MISAGLGGKPGLPANAAAAVAATPAAGRVLLDPSDGQSLTLVLAGDPDQSIAVGGWQESPRFGRVPATWYRGPDDGGDLTLSLAVDIRLVGGPDIARRLGVLRAMGRPVRSGGDPPSLRVRCVSLPLGTGDWVMQGLQLGGQVVQSGELVRQDVQVTLSPFVKQAPLERVTMRSTRSKANKRRARVIQSRPGDTMRAIAVRQLGSSGSWAQIRAWNKRLRKVDPDERLKTGTRVTLR